MKIVNNVAVFLVAAPLACIIAHAQQPTSAFRFEPVVKTGAKIDGETLRPEAHFENIAINNRGEVAFVTFHWPIQEEFGSAVLTPTRVAAQRFDIADGKILLDFAAAPLAIDESGRVVYEATYQENGVTHTGIFRDKDFLFGINGHGGADDFTLTQDGRVIPKAGIVTFVPPAIPYNPTPSTPPPAATGTPANGGGRAPQIVIKKRWLDQINKISPIAIPPDVLSPSPKPQPRPQQVPQQQPQPVKTPPPSVVAIARPVVCALPAYPMPTEWAIGADMKGPLASSIFDSPIPARPRAYESTLFGHMPNAFRTVHFATDCSPQVIVIGDTSLRGKYEAWTPQGLLTATQPDGYLQLPGFAGKALPGDLARRDAPFSINQRGQIAMPVSIAPEGYAIVLATPTGR